MSPGDRLDAPAVPPDEYDEQYYTQACAGYEAWTASGGAAFDDIYLGALAKAGIRPGERVVDIGTGRGELLAAAVLRGGAASAVGIEYSTAAIELATRTLEAHGVADRARVVLADARRIPLADGCADLVTMLDVVEHLSPAELALALGEARRLLAPGGRVLVHTAPNRTVYELTYRLQRALVPGRRRRWPADPRNDYEHRMHINEQSLRSLRAALRAAGFASVRTEVGGWVYTKFLPTERAGRVYRLLAKLPVARDIAVFDLWGEGRRA